MSSSKPDPFNWIDRSDLESPHANQRRIDAVHTLADPDGVPPQCAIHPPADEAEILTAWVAASGEQSFVDLEDMR
ncbi:DUF7511 domain-containing protein [Natrinema gari]|uniref:DUF7511 domain-containing protein n=1 Tax=Natrinema gari JCM 14663 TaxID=1230459 RepID=L9ZI43_9EURY|nr:hypothetical protein [Natrinema gari]ELY85267.1 hypothetical protein C486_00205 [Natrinema gari JCM 14663]